METYDRILVGDEYIDVVYQNIANDPYDLNTGIIVKYKLNNYFFRPNGSVAYLFTKLKDFKMCRYEKCIHRKKLTNCKFYVCNDKINIQSEENSKSSEEHEIETWETIIKSREIIYTAEQLHKMSRRSEPAL